VNSADLFYENALFALTATLFLVGVGRAWRRTKPYDLPQPLPPWFKVWFFTVQTAGGLLPLFVLIWSVWHSYFDLVAVLASYFLMLGLQILSESVSLRHFHSTSFVMVPYLYLPYRIWQLSKGLMIVGSTEGIGWISNFIVFEIVLWTINYLLDLSQLPRLLYWDRSES